MYDPNMHDERGEDPEVPIEDNRIVRSTTIHSSEIMSYIPERLIAEMGELPTRYYDTHIIVTVVVTPLPDNLSIDPGISPN